MYSDDFELRSPVIHSNKAAKKWYTLNNTSIMALVCGKYVHMFFWGSSIEDPDTLPHPVTEPILIKRRCKAIETMMA